MKEPIKTGMYQGELITHEGHEKMLDDFMMLMVDKKQAGRHTNPGDIRLT